MSLVLTVDGDRWRTHLRRVAESTPGLVPVAKGNGYGFGMARLARKAQWLGMDTLAVGTYEELPEVASRYDGDLLVLSPWRPFAVPDAALDDRLARRVVHTVSRLEDLADLSSRQPGARIVLERLTSMRRHGVNGPYLAEAARLVRAGLRFEGFALHLPLASGTHLAEVEKALAEVEAAGLPTGPRAGTLWVSHLTADELARLQAAYPGLSIRPRVGTGLWLGDLGALRATATVLDVHKVSRRDVFGYRGRSAPGAGHLVVVSGGTAHGIGLEVPTGDLSLRARAASVARGGLDAVGRVRSPFWIDGKQRWFAEPPHMQASMVFLPGDSLVPDVGDPVDVRVRYTATTFDRVELT